MKLRSIILIFIMMGLNMATAQDVMTFDQAVSIALKQNHQIEIARNNAIIAKKNVNIGNADLLPNIGLSGSANYQDSDGGIVSDGASTHTSAQVSAGYTLFDGFGNVYRFKKLQASGRLGEIEALNLIESTLLQVSQAYYTAASAYENFQIARELLIISQERLDRARQRSAYGQARTIDVLAAQVDLNSDSVTVTQAKFLWDESKRGLNVLLNRDVGMTFLVDTAVTFRTRENLESLKTMALNHNADYLAVRERLIQSRFDLSVAKSAHLPRVDLSTSYGYSQTASDLNIQLDDPSRTLRVGATISMNFFNGFKTSIQRQNAQIDVKNQELRRQEERLNLEKDVTSSHEAFHNSLLVLDLEERSLEAAELNFRRTQELYNLGQVTTTQFREAQLNLIRAKSNLSNAKYDAKLNEIELLRLTGMLVE